MLTRQGWTAVWAGLALFGVIFVWQVPHFLAIAVMRASSCGRRTS